ncbi:hypothetical protein ACFSC4_14250 [Deinococcus malanensis]|uniref:hypothetical protein n=1 Tax=Deinococcus malanensis TaxID=1706855 RepID=UPI0036410C94
MLAAGTAVTRVGVEEALGLPPGERVRGIAGALVLGDAGSALQGAAQLYRDGFAARTVVEGLVSAVGTALHAELGLSGERLEGPMFPGCSGCRPPWTSRRPALSAVPTSRAWNWP